MRNAGIPFVAAVRFARGLDAGQDRGGEFSGHFIQAHRRPATGYCAQMHKIESGAIPKREKPLGRALQRGRGVERLGARQGEDGVIKIRASVAVGGGSPGVELPGEKLANQRGGIAQQPGGETGHLKELEAEAHRL